MLREVITRSFPDVEFERPRANAEAARSSMTTTSSARAARHPLIWTGVLHHDYQSTPVRVRNISAPGR